MKCYLSELKAELSREEGLDPHTAEAAIAFVSKVRADQCDYTEALITAYENREEFPAEPALPAGLIVDLRASPDLDRQRLLRLASDLVGRYMEELVQRDAEESFEEPDEEKWGNSGTISGLREMVRILRGDQLGNVGEMELRELLRQLLEWGGRKFGDALGFLRANIDKNRSSRSIASFIRGLLETGEASCHWAGEFTDQELDQIEQIREIGTRCEPDGGDWFSELLPQADGWSLALGDVLAGVTGEDRKRWEQLLELAASAKGTRPAKTFMKKAGQLIDNIRAEQFWLMLDEVENAFGEPGVAFQQLSTIGMGHVELMHPENVDRLRGIVWVSALAPGPRTALTLERLMDKGFEKIPMVGPRCEKLGQAVIDALIESGDPNCYERFNYMLERYGMNKNIRKRLEKALAKVS